MRGDLLPGAELAQLGRQAAFFDEARQRLDARRSDLLLGLAFAGDAPYIAREAGELRDGVPVDVAVIRRVDDRQPLPVVAVRVSAQLVLDLVRFKVGQAADLEDAVFRHRGIPHQVAARGVVVQVVQHGAHIGDRVAHDGLRDLVRDVVFVRAAEVGLHRVAERVKRAGNHLGRGEGHGVHWVEDGEARRGGNIPPLIPPDCFGHSSALP